MDATNTKTAGPPIDSGAADAQLLQLINAKLHERIARARWSLQQGLKVKGTWAATQHFEQALRELGRLGAE